MVFTDFIKIRDKLSDIAYNNNSFSTAAASLMNEGTETAAAIQGTCQVANQFIRQNGSSISIDPIINGVPDPSLGITIDYTDIEEHLPDTLPMSSYTVGDIFQTLSDSGDLYSALAMITQKFSYSNRLTLTDLNAMIDSVNYQSGTSYDISDLKTQLLAVSTSDGYVTNKSWLMAMSNWIKSCKDGADNQSPELDNTSPNVLSGLYDIVMQGISTALSALFTALGVIFNGIWILIGTAFSKLFSTLIKGLSSSGSINPEASNLFTKGVAISHQEHYAMANPVFNSMVPLVSSDYSINFVDLPSCGFFFWKGDGPQDIKANAYIAPRVSARVMAEWLNTISSSCLTLARDNTYTYGRYYLSKLTNSLEEDVTEHIPANKNLTMSEDEFTRCSADLVYYSKCVCVSEFYRWLCYTPNKMYFNGTRHSTMLAFNGDPDASLVGGWGSRDAFYRVVYFGYIEVLKEIFGSSYPFDFINTTISDSTIIDAVNRFVADSFDSRDQITDVRALGVYSDIAVTEVDYQTAAYISRDVLICDSYNSIYHTGTDDYANGVVMEFIDNGSSIETGSHYFWSVNNYDRYFKANSLPVEFCAEYSAVTSDALWAIIITISLVAISAAVVSLKVSKAVRLKKIRKSILRTSNINDAKERWQATLKPDPETGQLPSVQEQKQALDAYVKEVDRFNRLGKIFHWGSYDAANSWVDRDTGGSSEPTSMSNILGTVGTVRENTAKLLGYDAEEPVAPEDTVSSKLTDIIKALSRIENLIH